MEEHIKQGNSGENYTGYGEYEPEELFPVVMELAKRYAGCDSTSVTYERAQSLMEAVLYCLREYDAFMEAGGDKREDACTAGPGVQRPD